MYQVLNMFNVKQNLSFAAIILESDWKVIIPNSNTTGFGFRSTD